ncbi:LysE family translocator [Acinetobacter wuhouensis]|uniref:LysE family translocator n=1 Tax=Acinetobacter wuhouensis TaxID=1879050 RepID=UPI00083A29BA|nr:LysE family translocator [Acinetobacter wuhouensis]AXQ23287.1 LysE family translocator [Acinetobacter wuhouensis]
MISWFFVGLVVTILLTPGPTNTLLASSGIQVGIRKSLGLIPAEALGYFISISLWGVIIGSVSKHFPSIPVILKLFSAGYILFLALKLWRTSDHVENFDQATIGIRELFIATLLNPKALLFASAIFPAFVWHNLSAYISHMLVFLMMIIPIAFFWTFIGSVLCSNKVTWLNQRNMQRTASLVLVSFTVPLSYSAILSL